MKTPEELEAQAGKLLVEAARARKERKGPNDDHEIRHILVALEWGNSENCGERGIPCVLNGLTLTIGPKR